MENRDRVLRIIEILNQEYPNAKTALHFSNPLELLIATVLSAQCTDKRVNMVTEDLFKKYRTAADYSSADIKTLEEEVRSTGFFKNKARAIKELSTELQKRYGGEVPARLEDLVSLPGVGRKTANVVLGEAFGIPGIIVDTHVKRLSNLIGLTQNKDPEKIELDLMGIVPQQKWTLFSDLLIQHGRAVCIARSPKHDQCKILDLCNAGVEWKKDRQQRK